MSSRPSTPKFYSYHERCGQPVNNSPNHYHGYNSGREASVRVTTNPPNTPRRTPTNPLERVGEREQAHTSQEPTHQYHQGEEQQQKTSVEPDNHRRNEHTLPVQAVVVPTTVSDAEPSSNTEEAPTVRSKHQRSRLSRRLATKSEPVNHLQGSGDGVQDSEPMLGSGIGSTIESAQANKRRRVSAPSDPPTGTRDNRTQRPRRTRNRHWRLKNKTTDRSGKSNNTSSSTTATSGGRSTDESVTAPFPSPAAGVQLAAPSVRFALGS